MKICFLGAARTVTGSCYVMECCGSRFAVDCGMYQGNEEIEKRNADTGLYRPKDIDFIIITHAHIDHSGLLPRLAAKGFSGPVYCSEPTRDLLEIMLRDSAHIQEMEAEWRSTKRRRHGNGPVNPLYTTADAEQALQLLAAVDYDKPFSPADNVTVTLRNAGHILGSAFVRLEYLEEGRTGSMIFSGDLGRPEQLIIADPEHPDGAPDVLVLESTYGDRDHKDEGKSLDELAEAIAYAYGNREKVVIPAFAVERTQQLIYSLFLLHKQGRLPKDMPVYLDSPLAIKATEIFRKHPEYFDDTSQEILANGENPLDLPNLIFTQTTDESRAINASRGSAVIISASGMATAGRIKHHLKHNLWRGGASVVFVGFQAMGTPGRRIVNGAKTVRLFGEEVAVAAKVFTIGGFSGHAGQSEILAWLDGFLTPEVRVILTHGEPRAQDALAAKIKERFGVTPVIPDYLEEMVLEPGRVLEQLGVADVERGRPTVDWNYLVTEAARHLEELRKRAEAVRTRSFVEQTDLRDRLMEINRLTTELISEM